MNTPRAKRSRPSPPFPQTSHSPDAAYDLGLRSVLRRDHAARLAGNPFRALAATAAAATPAPRAPKRRAPQSPPPAPALQRLTGDAAAGGSEFLLVGGGAVAVAGAARMTVLRGAVAVMGYTATVRCGPLPIASAPLGPFLLTLAAARIDDGRGRDGGAPLAPAVQAALLERLPVAAVPYAVVRFEPLGDGGGEGGGGGGLLDAAMPLLDELPLPGAGLGADCERLVPGLFLPGAEARPQPVRPWASWPTVVAALRQPPPDPSGGGTAPVVLVCGDHSTGKSMLARSLVNHLLSSSGGGYAAVLYVETDVGQPEASPAGLVAATTLRAPLLGPPAVHNATPPQFASFLGEASPREHVAGYAACVARVLGLARAHAAAAQPPLPVVVNSDGWVSGTGAELLRQLVAAAAPTHVFATAAPALSSTPTTKPAKPAPSSDGPGTTPSRSNSRSPASSSSSSSPRAHPLSHLPEAVADALRATTPTCRAVLTSPHIPPASKLPSPALPAPVLRDLALCCYFAPCLYPPSIHTVSLRDITVAFTGGAVPGTHVLAALRGALVCLATTSAGNAAPTSWAARGLGLVRAVDAAAGLLHVATPLPAAALAACDALIVSTGLAPPAALVRAGARGGGREATAPYVVTDTLRGAGAMRSRSTLARR